MYTKPKSAAFSLAAFFILLFIVAPLAFLWGGYVITVLWGWFVVPFGIQQIGILHAAGLSILVAVLSRGYVRSKNKPKDRTDKETLESAAYHVAQIIFAPAFVLLFGWIAHLGM